MVDLRVKFVPKLSFGGYDSIAVDPWVISILPSIIFYTRRKEYDPNHTCALQWVGQYSSSFLTL